MQGYKPEKHLEPEQPTVGEGQNLQSNMEDEQDELKL